MAAAISKTARTDITPKLRDGSPTSKVVFFPACHSGAALGCMQHPAWSFSEQNTVDAIGWGIALLGVFPSKTTRSCVVGWKMPAFFMSGAALHSSCSRIEF
jgi:hypothetical protein